MTTTEFRAKTSQPQGGGNGRLVLISFLAALLVVGAVFYGLFRAVLMLGETGSALLATALVFLLPVFMYAGYYFGTAETKGFLKAADQLSSRWFDKITQAVSTREQSQIRVHNATKPGAPVQVGVMLPGLAGLQQPLISDRTGGEGSGEIIDM
jgi:hypothetical protein